MSEQKFVVVGTAAGTTITVNRKSATGEHSQGLVFEADHPMTVGDVESSRVVLWAHSAPETTSVVTGDAGDLRIWHVWRNDDLIQAWEGDARLMVDDSGDDLGLECYDGHDAGTPTLVVRINFDRAWTQPSEDRL